MSLIPHTVGASAWVMALSERTCGSWVKLWSEKAGWLGTLGTTMESGTELPLLWCASREQNSINKFLKILHRHCRRNAIQTALWKTWACFRGLYALFSSSSTCCSCLKKSLSKGCRDEVLRVPVLLVNNSGFSPGHVGALNKDYIVWLRWKTRSPWIMHVLGSSTLIIFLWFILIGSLI